MASATHSKLVKDTENLLAAVKSYNGDRAARLALATQLELLRLEVEDPMDTMITQWGHISVMVALNVFSQLGVFEKLPLQGSMTAAELATEVGKDESVITRFMRLLTAAGIMAEVSEDTYAHTSKSMVYRRDAAADFFNISMNMMPCYIKLPEFFEENTLEDMLDIRKTPYSYAYGPGRTYYEVLSEKPETLEMFNRSMMQQEATLPVLGMFPFSKLQPEVEAQKGLLTAQKDVQIQKDCAFIVDVGGGRGQSLLAISKETSGGFGAKMILQDLPHVLDTITADEIPGIEKMAYDFYTPQPVKDAHIYFLRRIMHNYQDATCVKILKNTTLAMGAHSRLLIGELVVPNNAPVGSDLTPYWMDIAMLAIGGKERSEKEFSRLLSEAGLKLVKVWPAQQGMQAIIEAVLAGA